MSSVAVVVWGVAGALLLVILVRIGVLAGRLLAAKDRRDGGPTARAPSRADGRHAGAARGFLSD